MLHTLSVSIRVIRDQSGWHLHADPPHVATAKDATVTTPTEALVMLLDWGIHSTDATDALDASGSDWRPVHDREVQRRRGE